MYLQYLSIFTLPISITLLYCMGTFKLPAAGYSSCNRSEGGCLSTCTNAELLTKPSAHTVQQQPKIKATHGLGLTYLKNQDQAAEELLKQQTMGIGSHRFISAAGSIPMQVPLFVKKDWHGSSTAENNSKLSFGMEVFCWSLHRSLTDFYLSADCH